MFFALRAKQKGIVKSVLSKKGYNKVEKKIFALRTKEKRAKQNIKLSANKYISSATRNKTPVGRDDNAGRVASMN